MVKASMKQRPAAMIKKELPERRRVAQPACETSAKSGVQDDEKEKNPGIKYQLMAPFYMW